MFNVKQNPPKAHFVELFLIELDTHELNLLEIVVLNYESKQLNDVFQIWTSQTTDFKHWSKSCFKCRNILEALCPEICARSGVNKLSGKGKITNILDYVGHV